METAVVVSTVLGLLLLPLLIVLLAVLCLRCRELPGSYETASSDRRSPQPPGGTHRMPSSRKDSDAANSVASYENEEAACEDMDEDEDEEDYHNEGYLEVLPDSTPATSTAVPPAPVLSNPGLRDSAFSMESGEDYVNVPESEESAEASLDGSREYVNVSQELQPAARTEPATSSSQDVEEEEEEGAPDYENL
ncbi:linker for activation of T-cells family member 1 isoform 3-T3 [Trichechus inunguis]